MKKKKDNLFARNTSRRAFLTTGTVAAGAATMFGSAVPAFAGEDESSRGLTKGDIAILRFLQALETIEADLWRQYAELGGPNSSVPGTQGLSPIDLPFPTGLGGAYIPALQQLDGDLPQYIADNTDDELSHAAFLNSYLEAKDIESADLTPFLNIAPSQVPGVPQIGRLTNLTQLTVDTSWWTRYRSDSANPDLGGTFTEAVPGLFATPFPAIPRSNADVNGAPNFVQAIANVAGFHFAFIEQGGTSLYPSLAQRVTHPEVLRILLSIGPTEAMHFQTWHDKAGNANQITDTDRGFPGSTGATVSFPNLNDKNHTAAEADALQTNLIMPEPTFFLNKTFGRVSIIRPTETKNAAKGAVAALTADGLFLGQSGQFFQLLQDLAEDADEATRGGA